MELRGTRFWVLQDFLYKYIGEEKRVEEKRVTGKKSLEQYTQNDILSRFLMWNDILSRFSIADNSKTTPPRVKILPSINFLGSN